MEYKEKSLTRDGATLFATADANKKALVIDKMVISDHVVTAGTDLSTLTLADFTNAKQFDANNASQNTNSFTVTSVLTNEGLAEELNVALIGLLAHVEGAEDDAHIIAVAVGNDPFSLPIDQGTVFKLVPSITVGFSYAETVNVTVTDDVYVTQANLQDVLKAQGFATEKELEGYLKTLPANVALTDKANVFTEAQTLSAGAVNGAGKKALFDGDVDVPSDVVRADMLKPNLIDVATDTMVSQTNWKSIMQPTFNVVAGQSYSVSVKITAPSTSDGYVNIAGADGTSNGSTVKAGTTGISTLGYTAKTTGTVTVSTVVNGSVTQWSWCNFTATNTKTYVDYPTAQYNRHAYAIDKEQDTIGTRNLLLNTGNPGSGRDVKLVGAKSIEQTGNLAWQDGWVNTTATGAETYYRFNNPNDATMYYKPGQTYTLIGITKASVAGTLALVPQVSVNSSNGWTEYGETKAIAMDVQSRAFIFKFTVPSKAVNFFVGLEGYGAGSNGSDTNYMAKGEVWGFKEVALYEGDYTPVYMPAPEDITQQIADAKQQAIDQIQPLIDAEFKKRNVPSYFWSGDATAYAAVTPKVADADYSVFGGA